MKRIAILGSTGSVGKQTCAVLSRFPNQYKVEVLVARQSVDVIEQQIKEFSPRWVVLTDSAAAQELRSRVSRLDKVEILSGEQAVIQVLEQSRPDLLVAAMVGNSGLMPVVKAIEYGINIALANKEVLVMAGALINQLRRKHNVQILPLDSEHSAIFQCLAGTRREDVKRLVLTASGGPFRGRTASELQAVTPAAAVAHPNWSMGAKISVDSATLMNKGLEVIEAHWLFDVKVDQIKVLVHPQSIVHSMVELKDGSVLAQMGVPSMELPIQLALTWPERWSSPDEYFVDWLNLPPLTFEAPDTKTFPCLNLAYQALRVGGNAPTVLSVANDICVEAFLETRLDFLKIPQVIEAALAAVPYQEVLELDEILTSVAATKEIVPGVINNMR